MSNRLEEIKNEWAIELHFDSWEIMRQDYGIDEKDLDEISKRYAQACCQASLEKASENGEINKMSRNAKTSPYHNYSQNSHEHDRYVKYEINKNSIINKENIVLL